MACRILILTMLCERCGDIRFNHVVVDECGQYSERDGLTRAID